MPDLDAGRPAVALLAHPSDDEGTISVAISGELDISNAEVLRKQFEPILALLPATLIIDIAELTFMDSSGIALLVQLATRIDSITLRNASPLIRRVLEATGVTTLLGVEP